MAISNQKTSTAFIVAEEQGQGASQGGADIQGWSPGVHLQRSEGVWGSCPCCWQGQVVLGCKFETLN